MDWIERYLTELKEKNLYREIVYTEGLTDLCSNDYLGLRNHPEVVEEARKVLEEEGLGSGASQLVSGWTEHHRELEEVLARLKGTPSCVLFGSGYLANIGTIPALAGEGDLILSDQLNHASIIDACRLSRAKTIVYRHRDYDHLKDILRKERENYTKVLIVTDSLFSMDGDVADLATIIELSEEFETMVYIDDAHATGTLGKGRGSLEHFGIPFRENIVIMGTLSKAIGAYGAFVSGTEKLTEYLINTARSLIFTTSLPPPVCAGARRAVELILENPSWCDELRDLSEHTAKILKVLPAEVIYSGTPIIPIVIGEESRAFRLEEALRSKGYLVKAIRYPTVEKGRARLRLTVSLRYSRETYEDFAEVLEGILSEM